MLNKVYIASSSVLIEECKSLAKQLEDKFNFTITRRWWEHYVKDLPEFKDYSSKEFYSQPIVQIIRDLDFKAVRDADIVIILCKEGHKPTGAMVECGYAIAFQKIVVFLGKIKKCSMLSGCIHISTKEELFELIKRDCRLIED